ncbi:MAG: hypothetical protein ACRCTI_11780, partial [Beijerinckiaceae bacterium]
MTAELGHFALVLSLAVAALQAFVPWLGVRRGDAALMRFGARAALLQFLLVGVSFGCLAALSLAS